MGTFAAIIGGIGGLCAVMGILVAGDILRDTGMATIGWSFWFALSGILMLSCIALLLGRSGSQD